jgi:hypothetical protein
VQQAITSGTASTIALEGSTEKEQFEHFVDPIVELTRERGIETAVSMVEAAVVARSWEASDELMPSGD